MQFTVKRNNLSKNCPLEGAIISYMMVLAGGEEKAKQRTDAYFRGLFGGEIRYVVLRHICIEVAMGTVTMANC